MTNSQAANHESWLVRCSPCAPGFSPSNQQYNLQYLGAPKALGRFPRKHCRWCHFSI